MPEDDGAPTETLTQEQIALLVTLDPQWWAANYAKFKGLDGQLRTGFNGQGDNPKLNILQVRVLEHYRHCQAQGKPCLIMILKPRQRGASTIAELVAYHHMRKHPNLNGSLMGDIGATSDKVFEMYRRYAENDEYPWQDGLGHLQAKDEENNQADSITLPNGSKWWKETAGSKNAGRSGTLQVYHGDEVAYFTQDTGKDPLNAVLNSFNMDLPTALGFLTSTANGMCYDGETEILTDEGWKLFKDLHGSEGILTKNPTTNVAYYQKTWAPVVQRYKGPMVHFEAQSVNQVVTPNHKMWVAKQKGQMKLCRADTLAGKTTDYVFDRAFQWDREGLTHVTIPEYTHIQGAGLRTLPPIRVPIGIWLPFLGHWLSDGNVRFGIGCKQVVLTQTKFPELFRASAQALADVIGCDLRQELHKNGWRFSLINAQLARYLKEFSRPKRIPRELLMGMSREQCRTLLDAIYEGDGDQRRHNGQQTIDYGRIFVGPDKALQDDIQELALKAGYATNAYGKDRDRKVTFTESTRAMMRHDKPPRVVQGFDGIVYCVSLPEHHLLMVRRKGTAQWSGNSGDFYAMWMDKGNDWCKIFAAWYEFPECSRPFESDADREEFVRTMTDDEIEEQNLYKVTLEQLHWRRQTIKNRCKGDVGKFRQEYPSSEEGAFLSSSRLRFDEIALKRMMSFAEANDDRQKGNLRLQGESRSSATWIPDPRGSVSRWEEPRFGCRYLVAVDTCSGRDQQKSTTADPDYHSAQVWRAAYVSPDGVLQPPALVALHHSRDDTDILAETVAAMAVYYGKCLIVPERNGMGGLHIVKVLVKMRQNVFRRGALVQRRKQETEEERLDQYGWDTDQATKKWIVDEAAPLIRQEGLVIKAPEVIQELMWFVVSHDGKCAAMPGRHDDHVIGACIALYNLGGATEFRLNRVNRVDLMRLQRDATYLAPAGFRRRVG